MRRVATAVPLLLGALLLAATISLSSDDDTDVGTSALTDELLVYCLTDDHRAATVQAGVLLGTALPGSTPDRVTLPGGVTTGAAGWPALAPEQFGRTCRALRNAGTELGAPRPAAGAGPGPRWSWLFSGVLSAVLAACLVEWGRVRDRRRAIADSLRTAGARLRRSVRGYTDLRAAAVTANPDTVTIREHRDDLVAQASVVLLDRPGSEPASRLLALLEDAAFDALLRPVHHMGTGGPVIRGQPVAWVAEVEAATEELARAVEHTAGCRNGFFHRTNRR